MISVIIPVYNVKGYINKCLQSIVSQSYENLEIILIDDGSTDGSGEICDEWRIKDERIKVIHKNNGGLSDARNAGIDIANGEFIAFIDSDDYILPDYFSYLFDLATQNNADLSVCQLITVDEEDNYIGIGGKSVDTVIEGEVECMKAFLKDPAIDTTAWRKLYRKELFDSGIRYPVGKYHEDVFTTYKIIALCKRIVIGSKPLYAYRQRAGSIQNSTFSSKHMDAITASKERYKFISQKYPILKNEASKGIIYGCNVCSMRIGRSHTNPSPYVEILQTLYRQYGINYITSNCRVKSKFFTLAAYLNVKWLIKMISKISK